MSVCAFERTSVSGMAAAARDGIDGGDGGHALGGTWPSARSHLFPHQKPSSAKSEGPGR